MGSAGFSSPNSRGLGVAVKMMFGLFVVTNNFFCLIHGLKVLQTIMLIGMQVLNNIRFRILGQELQDSIEQPGR